MKNLLFFCLITFQPPAEVFTQQDTIPQNFSEWEVFPILNYDSDVGFGYGGKGFLYNFLETNESFDLNLYNSTKGERWYMFTYSVPDVQRRQGKKYDAALDLTFEYDKWINSKYYFTEYNFITGTAEDKALTYTREPIEMTVMLSRGFTESIITELGIRYKSVSSYNFNRLNKIRNYDYLHAHFEYVSLLLNFRIDTRTNFLNPQKGFFFEIANEFAVDLIESPSINYYKIGFTGKAYIELLHEFVFASRGVLQAMSNVNYLLLLPLGGKSSLRGLPQDRYLSTSLLQFNNELRFSIWWRFGGIAGVDLGIPEVPWDHPNWIINPVAGLRFYMDNFVVRIDAGFGSEGTMFYSNFGHLF